MECEACARSLVFVLLGHPCLATCIDNLEASFQDDRKAEDSICRFVTRGSSKVLILDRIMGMFLRNKVRE